MATIAQLRAKNKAARARLDRLKEKGEGKSDKANEIRSKIQARKAKIEELKSGGGGSSGVQGSSFGLTTAGTGSTMVDQAVQGLTELGNKYADNEMIGGMVTGTLGDFLRTQGNTGFAIQYNDAFLTSLGEKEGNLENLRTGNTSKLMAQEAELTGGLMDKQGALQQEGLRVAGEEQRKGIQETGTQQRLGMQEQGFQNRLGIEKTGEQQRLGLVEQGRQNRLGIRETGEQQRLQIQETGRQDRMGVRERTQAQKNLRADARGAIRRSGARFFG